MTSIMQIMAKGSKKCRSFRMCYNLKDYLSKTSSLAMGTRFEISSKVPSASGFIFSLNSNISDPLTPGNQVFTRFCRMIRGRKLSVVSQMDNLPILACHLDPHSLKPKTYVICNSVSNKTTNFDNICPLKQK